PGLSRPSTFLVRRSRGCRHIGERSDAVLRTSMAAHDDARLLDRAGLVQRLDLLLGKAELLEHRIGVFAKFRRRRRKMRRRARQRYRLADQRELALCFAVDFLGDLKMLDL